MELNEIIQQRINKLEALKAKGVLAYPAASFTHTDIGQEVKDFLESKKVSLCGRITARRLHGKVVFMDLRDATGKIQLYIKSDIIGKDNFELLDNVEVADFLGVRGELFKTHTGEPTVKVEEFVFLSKALRPLPEKWHGLRDVEIRYRQRYLDLVSNEEVKKVFVLRSQVIKVVRKFLDERGFCEVETPMMHPVAGGATGRPFKTHHNEYDMALYLRIAPELYLKKLLVGGMDKVYEINRSFRNEGVSTRHNPEFTMLEAYCAYADYQDMMRLAEDLVVYVAKEVLGKEEIVFQGKAISLKAPWNKLSFEAMVKDKFGIEPSDDVSLMLKKLQEKGFARENNRLTRSQINKIIEDALEGAMSDNPTFVTDYFASLCPLAKNKKENPLVSERFELYIAGMEIANAYSELNDPVEQRRRFQDEIKELVADEKKCVDEDYVTALEHGMPPAGGLGVGIDRLVMLLLDQPAIRDVILFPLLRSEQSV